MERRARARAREKERRARRAPLVHVLVDDGRERVEDHPLTRIVSRLRAPVGLVRAGAASTLRPLPSSTKRRSATSAGTFQTRWHTSSAVWVLTKSRLPHWPTAPRLVTRAPMVTYSMYGPTGETSYSKATTPPRVHPNKPMGDAPPGRDSFGIGTRAGRNQRRPSNRHGYWSSRPFSSPMEAPGGRNNAARLTGGEKLRLEAATSKRPAIIFARFRS